MRIRATRQVSPRLSWAGFALLAWALVALAACSDIGLETAPAAAPETPAAAPETPAATPETPPKAKPVAVVYTVGSYEISTAEQPMIHPCYWKGTVRTDLPDGGVGQGRSDAITVSGGHFYIAGFTYDGHDAKTCYWKDGVMSALAGEGGYAICVDGDTVYTATRGNWGASYNAAYWIDKPEAAPARTDLLVPGANAYTSQAANGIAIVDGKVIVAGAHADVAAYWTGTTKTDLGSTGEATALCEAGGALYFSGYDTTTSQAIPVYWTKTSTAITPTYLLATDGTEGAGKALAIKVVSDTVYTVGSYTRGEGEPDFACLWTGKAKTDLSDTSSAATALDLVDGTIYVAGWYDDGTKNIPCYWTVKDGVVTKFDLSISDGGGYAKGIVVVME